MATNADAVGLTIMDAAAGRMRTPGVDDGLNNSSASSDFFSPISISFFQSSEDKLPPLHDSSWIGARLSPIHSFDREEHPDADEIDDDDARYTSIYHKALHESMEAGSFSVNERTRLLRGDDPSKARIHPLWNSPTGIPEESVLWYRPRPEIGRILCGVSGLHLSTMLVYDVYYSGIQVVLPWMAPTRETLVLMGAWMPGRILSDYGYWRSVSSLFLATSLVEWMLVCLMCEYLRPWLRVHIPETMWMYLTAAMTGQLWTAAWDVSSSSANNILGEVTTGCLCWGMAGVLTFIGMQHPARRIAAFGMAAVLLVVALARRPYNSVWGTAGAVLIGWSFGAATRQPTLKSKPKRCESLLRWIAWAIAMKALVIPGLWVFFIAK